MNQAAHHTRFMASLSSPRLEGFAWQEPGGVGDVKMFRNILAHGCQVQAIEAAPPEYDFCYSIGLYLNLLQPEILVIGVDGEQCTRFINLICRDALNGDLTTAESVRNDLFPDGRRIRFRQVPHERYFDYLGYGCWFYRSLFFRPPVCEHKWPLLQAIWADREGRFPDDANCDPRLVHLLELRPQPSPNT